MAAYTLFLLFDSNLRQPRLSLPENATREVDSTRSLLNTAKHLDENQTLMCLKEMEYQERQCAQMIEEAEKITAVLGDKVTGIQIQCGDLIEQIRVLMGGGKPK